MWRFVGTNSVWKHPLTSLPLLSSLLSSPFLSLPLTKVVVAVSKRELLANGLVAKQDDGDV